MDKFFRIYLRHIKRLRRIFTEFEGKVDVPNHEFGWVHFQEQVEKIKLTLIIKNN